MRRLLLLVAVLHFHYLVWGARPQEPLPPYPYDEEEVIFHNTADDVTLCGTLTLPRSSGPFPVVILLQGSGPWDRDYSCDGHKFFLVWADHLTREEIAVFRYDKRSAGKSTGVYNTSTLENFAKDALAGVEYLKSRSEINPAKIAFVGHSEGGMTAFLAASQSDAIACVVSTAAPCVNGEELMFEQEPLLQRIDGVPEEMITQTRELREQIFALLKEIPDRAAAENKLREVFTHYFSTLNPAQTKIAETYYGQLEQQIAFFNSAWFRYYLTYDPAITLKKVHVPILALNGSRDLIVTPEQNLKRLAHTLEEMGHVDFTVMELPQLNHAFQTCETGSFHEYEKIEETASPVMLNIMSDWLLQKLYDRS
jgi:uncharacterized protein